MMAGKGRRVPVYKLMKDADSRSTRRSHRHRVRLLLRTARQHAVLRSQLHRVGVFYIKQDAYKKAARPHPSAKDLKIHRGGCEKARPPGSSACTPRDGRPCMHIEKTSPPAPQRADRHQENGIAAWTPSSSEFAAARAQDRDAGRHGEEGPAHLRLRAQPGRGPNSPAASARC